jgi:hypothetical protein
VRTLFAIVFASRAGCAGPPPKAPQAEAPEYDPPGRTGADRCLRCHASVASAWENLSSHSAVLDCQGCHMVLSFAGAGHAVRPACTRCHSESSHPSPGASCVICHDPHGSPNVFLVRPKLSLSGGGAAGIHLSRIEGAGRDGLARAGVAGEKAGTGLCEVCHGVTRYYRRDSSGTPHEAGWCAGCHRHSEGFAAPKR